jgi:hypothetical protein
VRVGEEGTDGSDNVFWRCHLDWVASLLKAMRNSHCTASGRKMVGMDAAGGLEIS